MQMQRLTTNPPEDSMVECAIAAMQLVIAREELEAARAAAGGELAADSDAAGDEPAAGAAADSDAATAEQPDDKRA